MDHLRQTLRQLLKTPGFSLIAVLTLALGIGACAAMFGIINTVLLKPLPVKQPDQLVWIENNLAASGGLSARTSQVDTVRQWQTQSESFEDIAGYFPFFDYSQYTLTGTGEPQRIRAVPVTANLIDVLGISLALGRNFSTQEAQWNEGDAPAAVLGHRFWQQHFAADPMVLGRTLTINNKPVQIVGVLPRSFEFDALFTPGADVDMLLPFPMVEQTQNWGNTLFAIARLKPGVSLQQAQAELDTISARVVAANPQGSAMGAAASTLEDHVRGRFRSAFLVLFGAVLCVLLIVCLNVSNLLLARAQARRTDVAVRIALGAGRWQLIARTLAEVLLLALAGGTAGLLLAVAVTAALTQLHTFNIPLLQTATFDIQAALFTLLATAVACVLCSLLPVIALWRGDVRAALTEAGSRGASSRNAAVVRKTLVATQIALACMLLAGSGALMRGFFNVINADKGFQPDGLMSWRVDSAKAFQNDEERIAYYQRLVAAAQSVPGVASVGLTDTLPLGRDRNWDAGAKDVVYPPGTFPGASPRFIDHNYLQTMRIELRAGRYFDDQDQRGAPPSMIINQTMAQRLWGESDPIGKWVVTSNGDPMGAVVGVVADVPRSLDEASSAEMYFDVRQRDAWSSAELLVRSSRAPSALITDMRAALHSFDPALASGDFTTLHAVIDRAVAPRLLTTSMLGGFSTLALLLAGLGLYGVISYSVAQRDRELAIRMAIGSQRRDNVRLIMVEGLQIAAIGLAIGSVATLFGAQLLQKWLLGAADVDLAAFAVNGAIIVAVALLASLVPALRAGATEPVGVLR